MPDLALEQRAREKIDAMLAAAGWLVQTKDRINLLASRSVVIEGLEAVVSANLQRATGIRQSILQKAFNGNL